MLTLCAFFQGMLKLSYRARLAILLASGCLSFLLCVLFYPTPTGNGLLAVPVALATWLFKRRGAFICLIHLCLALLLFYLVGGLTFSWLAATTLVVSVLGLVLVALLVSVLRELVDRAEMARRRISDAYERQERLNQGTEQFVRNVSRELSTSLATIYGYHRLLLENDLYFDSKSTAKLLKNAMYNSEEVQLLIKNMLYSVQRDEEPYEELAVVDVVYEVLDQLDPRRQEEHRVQVNVPPYLVVRASTRHVRQILRNLLSNAFKYSAQGAPVVISAALHGKMVSKEHPAPQVCIVVKDFGLGIPHESMFRVFGQGARLLRDTGSRVRGAGLGLYVSKQLVEAMGGSIWIDSPGIPGLGTQVCFTLTCVPQTKSRVRRETSATKALVIANSVSLSGGPITIY